MQYKYLGPTQFVTIGTSDVQLITGIEYTFSASDSYVEGLKAKGLLVPVAGAESKKKTKKSIPGGE